MIERYAQGTLTWVDVLSPTAEELRALVDEYGIPPALMTNLDAACTEDAFKVTFHFPIVKRTDIKHPHKVTFIVTKQHLITIRYEGMEALHRFTKEFEVISTLYTTTKRAHGIHLFYALLTAFYDSQSAKIDYLESKKQEIEANMFEGDEKEMVFAISDVNHKLISFRQILKIHEGTLELVRSYTTQCFGEKAAHGIEEIVSQYVLLCRRTVTLSESVEAFHNTNFALLTVKQNEIMKLFTIMAFVTFPLTLFSSLFGMNTTTTPIIGEPGDFWVIVSIMVTITICFFAFFKYKRWI